MNTQSWRNHADFPERELCLQRIAALGSGSLVTYPQHDPVFNIEQDLLLLPVVPDEGVQRVTVRDPANEARIG